MSHLTDNILRFFEPLLALNPLIYVAIISMIPIVEVRGSVPIGIAVLGLPWWQVLIVSILAATLPAPFIVAFFSAFLNFLKEKKWLPWLTKFLDKKFAGKETAFGLSKFWGIAIFTAIPLPGTGGWTASGIASLIKMDWKQATLAVLVGNCIAASIMTLITFVGTTYLPALIALLVLIVAGYLLWKFVFKKKKPAPKKSEDVPEAAQVEDS